ncbi:MAG: hypothetical protein AAFX08_05905 [Pseudomonadota bacterium]
MFHPATKVTIIAERLLQDKLVAKLEDAGAKGYTIVDGGGKGEHFTRASDSASVVNAFSIIRIEAILASDETARAIATEIETGFFKQYSGVVYLSQVEVLRPERF